MDSSQIRKLYEEQRKNAEKATILNEKTPITRPGRDPPSEFLNWQMSNLTTTKMVAGIRVKQITSPRNPHVCKTQFNELKPICLCDMRLPMIHEGQYLVCKVVAKPHSVVGIKTLVEDLNGDVEHLSIYNYTYNVEDTSWLPLDTILIIKEPTLHYDLMNQNVLLRVDSPSDLIFVGPTDQEILKQIGAEKWYQISTTDPDEIREEGNKCFQQKDYEAAIKLYDRAIRYAPDMSVLYLNKAASQLRSGYFDDAYISAKIALEKGGNREEALYTMGQAAYGIRDWKTAADNFQLICEELPNNLNAKRELNRSLARIHESSTGIFDLQAMYLESQQGKYDLDVADYIGPIKIADVPGKGKGIVATENIPKRTLLHVGKAFAAGYQKDLDCEIFALNLITNNVLISAEKLQIIRAIENLRKNPSKSREVYAMYAGELPRTEEIPEGVVDTARIERISIYNRFVLEQKKSPFEDNKGQNFGLFFLLSYFNHACMANAKRRFMGDVVLVYASTDLKKDDEVTLAYVSYNVDYAERVKQFKAWNFICQCRLCKVEAEDEERTNRVEICNELVQLGMGNLMPPREVISKGNVLLNKMRNLYHKRTEIKIDLAQVLWILGRNYFKLSDTDSAIKYLEEAISLVDNEFALSFGLPDVMITLARCYLIVGRETEATELARMAFKTSLCISVEQFKSEYMYAGLFPNLNLVCGE